ncbi:glycosyltransferase family 4 protein [uncultured Winogradskyella sp.]|mgnify:CR=1 FL=1|uniref:glycosyltransferase family 4 protein n=1 Tax=uncultured Winogradskyella sp. TaxID=395353 RepID=UPI0030DBFBE1|tara:strand:- start:14211 stop:15218 length:1008 start_codon:yes stop_codon:yes gene_type:complete
MKNVLYIGNALSNNGRTSTTIEILGERLKEICSIKIASTKPNKVLRLFDMIRLVLKNKSATDFVLIDTYSTSNFYFAFVISQLCRVCKLHYIPILHGGNLEIRLKNNPKLSDLIFNNAYKLVAPSNFLKAVFQTYGYKDVLLISNFIEIGCYEFLNREIDDIKMLWVRSFSSIYNPQKAVLVMNRLLKKGFKTSLTMVGPDVDGSMDNVKVLALKEGLDVKFPGKLSKQNWVELSKKHNVFINTTNFDNTPVSVIEAMALGLPIVSTEVGGLPYLISNNKDGLLVPSDDADAMAHKIIELREDNSLRISLITNARDKVENFDWKNIKPKWQSLLQ